jgi:sterol desaturase/sphingolipid hydroxylase (fatty acid hydroxylase superfamily)
VSKSSWIKPALIATAFVGITVAEVRRPLRRTRESKGVRVTRNLITAGVTAAITSALQSWLLAPVVKKVERERLGLLNQIRMPQALRTVVGALALDYTLWWWHYANHRVPLLWRFHLVHHVDRDLDASTGLRFHFGEMALSVFYRMAQFRLLGPSTSAISSWQTLLFISIAFHHSNLRLPVKVERKLVRWLVTPRMHGIHHSDYREETDSNWSSLVSWWDRVHGTMRLDVPQDTIDIGVPAYQDAEDVKLVKITVMPFVAQREDWVSLDGVEHLARTEPDALEP